MIAQELCLLNTERAPANQFIASLVLGCTQHGGDDATPPGEEFLLTLLHPPKIDPAAPAEGMLADFALH